MPLPDQDTDAIEVRGLTKAFGVGEARIDALRGIDISVRRGDGYQGWEEHAPYDAIVISAAAPCIPRPLIEQLKSPGYLIFPMGEKELQTLARIRKDSAGIREEYLGDCHFVQLKGRYGWED